MKIVGNKIYDVCGQCGQIVCINKTIFGSTHVCITDEEKLNPNYKNWIQREYTLNKSKLDSLK